MPRLGLGLGVQVSAYSAYDADAASYFVRAGVTDTTAKRQISNFVEGAKELGLWNSMVCWPLRSAQNAGTGTTVYSLGGYGINNGTMVGTLSWGTNGIIYPNDSTFKHINTPFTMAFDSSNSNFAVGALTATPSTNRRYIGASEQPASPLTANVPSNTTLLLNINAWSEGVNTNVAILGAPELNTFNWLGASWNYVTETNNFNGQFNSTFGTQSRASSATGKRTWTIGGGQSLTDNFAGTMAFASYFPTADVSQANKLLLYNLYKTTLGQGLSLP
jgi:hypothetical protein